MSLDGWSSRGRSLSGQEQESVESGWVEPEGLECGWAGGEFEFQWGELKGKESVWAGTGEFESQWVKPKGLEFGKGSLCLDGWSPRGSSLSRQEQESLSLNGWRSRGWSLNG